jgi:hypothetical protein
MPEPLYFRRRISIGRDGLPIAFDSIVYAVRLGELRPAPGIIAVLGAFPPPWRPTENPGEALLDRSSAQAFFDCEVPRATFKHFDRISEAEAQALYPEICAHVALPRLVGRRWWNAWERQAS